MMYDHTEDDHTTIVDPDDFVFDPPPREIPAWSSDDPPDPDPGDSGPIMLMLRSTDHARRALRRCALRYAAKILRQLGYVGAALALEIHVWSEPEVL